jgi:threonylcarbamoyladenosine tRNA methylthiotransferase MtaB
MPTFSIENFGCRATEVDASALSSSLLASGLTLAADPNGADVVVLNTCTVTAAADAQARDAVRKIQRANPAARIVVTGCYAQREPDEVAAMEGVEWVVGNSRQAEIPEILRAHPTRARSNDFVLAADLGADALSLARGPAKILTGDIFAQATVQIAPAALSTHERTRPILKIQDGCNNRCSYCVIPFVRGKSRSLPPDEVIGEVRALCDAGAKEIVLSGINLGSYGRDLAPRAGLAEIVRRILDETALDQLRFSSIEPQDVTEDFVALVASSPRIARHFHIPLQSGSDRILRAMHRWYRTAHYAERLHLIRRMLPEAAIGADVIVGFPGETDAEFRETLEFVGRLPFTYLHVFSFSERPGTAAVELGERIPVQAIRERARILRDLSHEKAAEFRAAQAGRTTRALTLARGDDTQTEALTGNYLKVQIAGRHSANEWHEVSVDSVRGVLLKSRRISIGHEG